MADDEGSDRPPLPLSSWVACYYCTKHSWRGKYKRIFAVGETSVATLNPVTFEETNRWDYRDEFVGVAPGSKPNEFVISVKKRDSKKASTVTFSSDYRDYFLTSVQFYWEKFDPSPKPFPKYPAFKYHWSEQRVETILTPMACGLAQVDRAGKLKALYNYKDIEAIALVEDYPGGFVVCSGGHGRMHMFALENRDELLVKVSEYAATYVAVNLKPKKKTITLDQFRENRLGKYNDDTSLTSLAEFSVSKLSPRHVDPVVRVLCLSETCLIERDPSTYAVVTCRPFVEIFALVRSPSDPQRFTVEYLSGENRTFLSTDRDSLLATLLDSVRAAGNRNVCVQVSPTSIFERFSPLRLPPDEEVESSLLKYLGTPSDGVSFQVAVHRFNCNVNYGGLVHAVTEEGWFKENKEKLIMTALTSLLRHGESTESSELLTGEFMALRRLVASKAGFQAFTNVAGFKEQIGSKVIKALQRNDDGVTLAALDMLCTLMQPMHDNYDLAQEKVNKGSLLKSTSFIEKLAELLKAHADMNSGALVVSSLLDFFTFALCHPYSETTEGEHFDSVLHVVANLGRSLFSLFQHSSLAIVKASGLIMKTIIEEGDEALCQRMQAYALAEGALPRHLLTALFTKSSDNRLLTHRQLSRHLIGLWSANNKTVDALMRRIMPLGLLEYLKCAEQVPEKDVDRMHVRDTLQVAIALKEKKKSKLDLLVMHWRARNRAQAHLDAKKPVVLRKRRQLVTISDNWEYFYYQFECDHARADLIWNHKTREELREALEGEMRAFLADKELKGKHVIAWNHTEFEVRYESLAEEVKIGDHYLRLLLDEDQKNIKIHNPPVFFNDLYHRFLLTTTANMKGLCLQAMSVVYNQCHEAIGSFNDTEYFVTMLNRCEDFLERDRLLLFLNTLLHNTRNVKLFIDAGGLKCLVDFVTLAHLHVSRATVPLQTNVLEASASQLAKDEPEWYYTQGSAESKEKIGPIGITALTELYKEGKVNKETRMWAQGMDGWRAMKLVPQLKWTVVASGQPVMDLSSLAALVLNMLIRILAAYPSRDDENAIVRPLPRCKRMLSEANVLPHVAQLLLTFDPIIVEKVSVLLLDLALDNIILPRLYLTGIFYFLLMYTGSNILPIAKFFKMTHNFQAYRPEGGGRSILSAALPQSMVCFLDNYGPEKFASIFLGEFDTPEVIWGAEMRRTMIEKLALHLSDFTPRLRSNTRALYQFCPLAKISYKELEDELFCNIYYLRHFCDESRFPEWPVTNHIEFLKDILEAWKVEVEKKPASMSVEDAYTTLGLEMTGSYDHQKVRKAYFKLSVKYHPDKNPEGRDMFEKINKAYEFLSSRENRSTEGVKVENLVLILRAQSILFRRFPEIYQPYKYAGYPMLIVTVQRETDDQNLFSSSVGLLEAACELCYRTVECSALNAEELRREGGIEVLALALSRCISVIGFETSENIMAVKVVRSILKCYAAAAQFPQCRERIIACPQIVKDVARCLWFKGAETLTQAAIDCVNRFSIDSQLQDMLLNAGAMWHLIAYLFNYDFTLEESGVEASEKTHTQLFFNNHAKMAIRTLCRLGGFHQTGPEATPENPTIQKALKSLISPYLTNMLKDESPLPVLKLLNSNSDTPYLLWDNGTRAELTDFVSKQQADVIKTGEQDPSFGADFVFSAHANELIVDHIFVRIYNEQPAFPIKEPIKFCSALLNFVGSQAQFFWSLASMPDALTHPQRAPRMAQSTQALQGLRNLIKANAGVEAYTCGHYKLLFSLLRYDDNTNMQLAVLDVVACVVGNAVCVEDISEAQVLSNLFYAVETAPAGALVAIDCLTPLVAHTKIVQEILTNGGLVYLLDLFCNSKNPQARINTAALFAKILSDKLRGPKVRIILSKFLPGIFMDAMRDNPEASVTMFEGTHENPELIWNESSRNKVCNVIKDAKSDVFSAQLKDPAAGWRLPEDFGVVYEQIEDEVVVGGVFLRLLIKQPSWAFRKPKEFLVAIMEKYVSLITKASLDPATVMAVRTITDALVALLGAQNDLAINIPSLGHIGKIIQTMSRNDTVVQTSCLEVMNELCSNSACAKAVATCSGVAKNITLAIPNMERSKIYRACEYVMKVYDSTPCTPLIQQALDCDLINFLLNLLHDQLDTIEFGPAAKAHVVKALKSMTTDLVLGDKVQEVLSKCPWWSTYKDQRHDLFLSGAPVAGYLTGPTTAPVAGYLMAAPITTVSSSNDPPPDDEPPTYESPNKRNRDLESP